MLSDHQIRLLKTPKDMTYAELSEQFGVSINTIKYHVKVINRHLLTATLADAKVRAVELRIVSNQDQ